MGWFDYISDLASSITIQDSYAEQPRGQDEDAPTRGGASLKSPASGTDEESGEEAEANQEDEKKAADRSGDDDEDVVGGADAENGEDDGAEEEEEEEEEPKDPKEVLEEQCMNSAQCHSLKHHYDECAERVQKQIDDTGKPGEDCVEEFFHLMHCATQCAAPKLFKQLR